ncbi:MAG: hypothetical protein AB1798_19860 [Spirochaetota bacterium]
MPDCRCCWPVKSINLFVFWLCLLCTARLFPQVESPAENVRPYTSLSEKLDIFKELLNVTTVDSRDFMAFKTLSDEIEKSQFPDLISKSRMLRFLLESELDEKIGLQTPASNTRGSNIILTLSLGTGIASLGLFTLFSALSDADYKEYLKTTSPRDAAVYQGYWQRYDVLSYLFAGTTALGFGLSVPLIVSSVPKPGTRPAGKYAFGEETELDSRIKKLETQQDIYEKRINNLIGSMHVKGLTSAAALSLGFSSLYCMGIIAYQSSNLYTMYRNASNSSDAEQMHKDLDTYNLLIMGTGLISGFGFSGALVFSLFQDRYEGVARKINVLNAVIDNLADASLGFPSKKEKLLSTRIDNLEEEKHSLKDVLIDTAKNRGAYNAGTFISLGAGFASFLSMWVTSVLSQSTFKEYNAAKDPAASLPLKDKLDNLKRGSLLSGIVCAASLSVATFIEVLRPRPSRIKKTITEIDKKINALKVELAER